ncbi:MAG: DUF167 domain-containing protein [Anaerolineae bacterium]
MAWAVEEREEGVRFRVRVIPRASRDEVAGLQGEALRVRLTAPPVEGAANRALVEFLARQLGVRKGQVWILSGEASREKVVAVEGVEAEEVRARLLGHPGAR